jgi:hypothetical protein
VNATWPGCKVVQRAVDPPGFRQHLWLCLHCQLESVPEMEMETEPAAPARSPLRSWRTEQFVSTRSIVYL